MCAPETAPKPGRWTRSVTCSRSPRRSTPKAARVPALLGRVFLRQMGTHACAIAPGRLQLRYGASTGPGATCALGFSRYRPPSVASLVASALTPGASFLTTNVLVATKLIKIMKSYQKMYPNQLNKRYIQQTTSRLDLPVIGSHYFQE